MAQTTDETKHVEIDPARRMAVLENGVYTQSHNMLHVFFKVECIGGGAS